MLFCLEGHAFALCRLGEVYEFGWLGEKVDEERSLDFYERAAAKDDANALSRLGEVYEHGYLKQQPWPGPPLTSGNMCAGHACSP